MWAWAHEEPEQQTPEVDASKVLAVLVAHNGDQWLPSTLAALGRSADRPGWIIAVDAGSTDMTRRLLEQAVREGVVNRIVLGDPAEGFGHAVNMAVLAAEREGFQAELLWLLHDDSAPRKDALAELILAIHTADRDGQYPAIVVPKLLHPKRRNHPDQMSAVGESIAPSGIRVLTVESGDIDQHQQEPARVLGASTAGMLIGMPAWRELGGLDPMIPLFRDGVELGWRANTHGMVVRTCPTASMRHVEAGRVGLRDSRLAPDSAHADMVAGMSVVVLHSPHPRRTIARLYLQALVNAVGYLLGKSPSLALGQLRAVVALSRRRPVLIERVRQRAVAAGSASLRGTSSSPAPEAADAGDPMPTGLLPDRGWGIRRFAESIAGRISDYYYDLLEDDDQGGMIDELTGDDFAGGRRQVRLLSPSIVGMAVMAVITLIASWRLIGFGVLSGPALSPAPETLGAAWAGWAQTSPGLPGANAPWLGFMALGSTIALGQPELWASLLMLGGPALAGFSAFHFLRPVSGQGWWTAILACLWGCLLPASGALNQGSLDMVIVAIMLPVLGVSYRRWLKAATQGAEGWRAPAAVALVVSVLASFVPLFWALGALVSCWVSWRRRDPRGALVALFGPLALLGEWLPRLIADPGRFLVGSDPLIRLAGNAPGALRVLTGGANYPVTPLGVGIVVFGVLWAVGCYGLWRARHISAGLRLLLAAGIVGGPVIAMVISRFVITVAGFQVRPDAASWALLGSMSLLLAAAYGIGRPPERSVDDSVEDLADQAQDVRVRNILGWILACATVVAAIWWIFGGTSGLHRQTAVLPTYVTGVQESFRATRTLVIDLTSGTAQINLAAASSPTWGNGEELALAVDQRAYDELLQISQQFSQGQASDDLARRMARLAIGHVWLRGATAEAINNLSSSPLLGVAEVDASTVVFTNTIQPSQFELRVGETENSVTDPAITEPDRSAIVLLSQPADHNWRVSIGGEELPRADSGDWRQGFATEGRTGEIRAWRSVDWGGVLLQCLALGVLVLLAAPAAQRAHAPRRALTKHRKRGRAAGSSGRGKRTSKGRTRR